MKIDQSFFSAVVFGKEVIAATLLSLFSRSSIVLHFHLLLGLLFVPRALASINLRHRAPDDEKKTLICHVPEGNPLGFHSITVADKALPAHLAHGDKAGPCDEFCAELCDLDGDPCTVYPGKGNPPCELEGCPPLIRSLRFTLVWTSGNDCDIRVITPGLVEIAWWNLEDEVSGGFLDHDDVPEGEVATWEENIIFPCAPPRGEYTYYAANNHGDSWVLSVWVNELKVAETSGTGWSDNISFVL
jgi:hypothetical protein